MHDLHELLAELRTDGVQLWVENGSLRVRAPGGLSERRRTQLRQRREALIAHLERGGDAIESPSRPAVLPMSCAQEGLWFLDRASGSGAAYNLAVVLRLRGLVAEEDLLGALADMQARHEVLRTRYPASNGVGTQDILPPGDLDFAVVDISDLGEADAMASIQSEVEYRFDLEAVAPFRCRLYRQDARTGFLTMTIHHIVADAPSIAVIFDELTELYSARREGRPHRLPAPAMQYADFALGQRRRIENGDLDDQLAYWKQRLGDAPESLDLPIDRPRPTTTSFSGGLFEFEWSPALSSRIRAAARSRRMTPFMWMLGAFQLLLMRWSGQHDVCVGMPMTAHADARSSGAIGYFLNTIVVRAQGTPSMRVDRFFEQVRQRAAEAYQNSEVPFDVVVTSLRRARREGVNPLFQVMFAYDDINASPPRLADLKVERVLTELRTSKFDLSLFMTDDGECVRGGFEYASDLFDNATIARLAGHFETLTAALPDAGAARIGDLSLLRPEQRRQMLETWNDTGLALGDERTLHGLFARSADANGDRIALAHGSVRLRYSELDEVSNRLAHRLIEMGVGPERVVGVCMERRPEMVIGLLAILKAGGAYVPLDPAYPPARLALMLEDSRATVLLSQESLCDLLPEHDAELLCLDRLEDIVRSQSAERPRNRSSASNLAYLIYTSGSTGRPKGVALQHGNATASVLWAHAAFARETTQALLASTSICFDLSVFELFVPLLSGGTVVLVDSATSLIEAQAPIAPTLINTVPSAAKALVESGALPASLSVINLAGEPLPRALVEALYAAAPEARVFNLYGPSEYATYSTFARIESDPAPDRRVLIGKPVGNTRIYILDARGGPVPIGTPGEIFIAGENLARGYAHRPALTAERFVPDPFGPPGGRMYASGDLGRFLPDGDIDYLGRIDQQVKIRGFRIEPGEIEARLRRCSGVVEAAVVPRTDRHGDRQLVAHVVVREGDAESTADSLRAQIALDLPAHMIPAIFDLRADLPLTPNGKIDRKRLSESTLAGAIERARYVAPRDATESLLAEIWAEVLRMDRLGIDDDFFALGGHSLLAAQIVARLRQGPLPQIGLRDVFLAPTVRRLAERAADMETTAPEPIVPIDRNGPMPTSFSQQRMWFIDRIDPQSSLYNVCIAWRMIGDLKIDALHRSLIEIQRRHEILRTVFVSTDDGPPTQIVKDVPSLPMPVHDLSSVADVESEATSWLQRDAARPFDFANGPLFRAVLLKLAEDHHILQVGMPHIVVDGWSLDVILSELGVLYPAFVQGKASPLAPLPIQYGDYAHWERTRMQGETLEAHLRYSRELLAGAPKELRLPWDRPRPPASSFRGEVVEFVLDAALSERLRELARRSQVTLFMLMAAIFDVLLFRYSKQEDFCIGYSVGNRTRIETEGLIGPFVNVLVHRVRLSAKRSFSAHLARVRAGMLDADAHQAFPFERMVEAISPVRDLAHHPIFQSTYSYSTTHGPRTRRTRTLRGVGEREVSLPGLDLGLVEPGYLSAKFDLSFFVSDTGDELEGDLEFSTDLFDRETIVRLATHLDTLCRAVIADPDRPIGALDILPESERRRMLDDWNRKTDVFDAATSLHERFEAQAARSPHAIAIEAGETRLSYAQLDARANALARRLRRHGVGPEVRVAVCLGRRAELVVALLAVLKAGGAYVPLDPAYPRAMLAHMLTNSGAPIVLLGEAEASALPAEYEGLALSLADDETSADKKASASEDDRLPLPRVSPQNQAYCLYTSGSTGKPKAVAIQHDNALAMLAWAEKAYTDSDTARTPAVTSICFDLSVYEIFLPLVRGGCVILLQDVAAIATADAPSLINTVPTALNALLAEHALADSVRTVNLAGEALDPSLVAKIEAAAPQARIVNLYGPTEYTTYATCAEVGDGRRVTIGRPIDNTSIFILDERLEPTPIGVPGELYIAGAGLARGYLGHPALTAAKFVPNPYGPAGSRMYATGDLARYLPDGQIEFRGREDHQVKFHGFRIELSEIERVLRGCAGVADAVVLLREDAQGESCLAGFVQPEADIALSADPLREALARLLPRHMLPNPLIAIDALPRTPNGKIDRNALRAWRLDATTGVVVEMSEPVAPATETEILLAELWSALLDAEIRDARLSFFALGGNSMTAIRLVTRIAAATGLTLPLRTVFEHPILSALAAQIDAARSAPTAAQEPRSPIPSFDRRWTSRPNVVH